MHGFASSRPGGRGLGSSQMIIVFIVIISGTIIIIHIMYIIAGITISSIVVVLSSACSLGSCVVTKYGWHLSPNSSRPARYIEAKCRAIADVACHPPFECRVVEPEMLSSNSLHAKCLRLNSHAEYSKPRARARGEC